MIDPVSADLTGTIPDRITLPASSSPREARVRALESSAARQDVGFDALSASIDEMKQQARESNDLLRELAHLP